MIHPPDNATVEGDARLMEELFGTLERKTDWNSIKERLSQVPELCDANLATLKEVANAIYCVSKRICVSKCIIGQPKLRASYLLHRDQNASPDSQQCEGSYEDQIDCDFMFVEEAGGKLKIFLSLRRCC